MITLTEKQKQIIEKLKCEEFPVKKIERLVKQDEYWASQTLKPEVFDFIKFLGFVEAVKAIEKMDDIISDKSNMDSLVSYLKLSGFDDDKIKHVTSLVENVISERIQSTSWEEGILQDWYMHSTLNEDPEWTEEHIDELVYDFYVIPKPREEQDV